ncbi:hypothetical protein [Leisingera sp. M658]|uniref:hypothetical protein n=1 Tax=Leisingera sp. M658 TaxID=2867015 RepID=UPI0021A59950|nr:hypothetical protein [Leisingera sp. M658]UWQ77356.1 hypothetical protein K3724_22740 [Leisingera sp. M658]
MTVSQTGPLAEALVARLKDALKGKGLPDTEGAPAPDIPVSTKVRSGADRLAVRIEGFSMLQGNSNVGHSDRHNFQVRVTHKETGKRKGDPAKDLPRIEGLICDALKDFKPVPGATKIKFRGSFEADEPTPEHTSRVSRFYVNINGD